MIGEIAPIRARRALFGRLRSHVLWAVGAVCLTLVGCTSDVGVPTSTTTSSTGTPTTHDLSELEDVVAPEWEATSLTEEIAAAISEGGFTTQHAVDALALLVEGVPGASMSRLPPGDGFDASYTRLLIDAARDDLTPEQLAFVDDHYSPGRLAGTVTTDGRIELVSAESSRPRMLMASAGLGTSPPFAASSPPAIDDLTYLELLAEVHDRWKARLPTVADFEVELYFSDKPGGMEAWNDGLCHISVLADFTKGQSTLDEVRWYFAHELFHCIQGGWEGGDPLPPWVAEGSADFAAYDLFRNETLDFEGGSPDWFSNAHRPLKARSYTAWPLYENAQRSGIDVYSAIRKMVASPGPTLTATLTVGGLDGMVFRRDWSSRTLRTMKYDDTWWLAWPTHAPASGPVDNAYALPRGLGSYNVVGAGGFANPQLAVVMEPDVGLVTASPLGGPLTTWTANGTKTVADGNIGKFCFSPDGCRCPAGSTSSAIPMAGQIMLFSYPASETAVKAHVIAEPWDAVKECKDAPEPDQAESNGDPHLLTFDGLPYDVITLGEFITVRDPAGDFEVQTRHEPFMFGAGTTAVALGTGGSRITFTKPDFFAEETIVRVDGVVNEETAFEANGVEVIRGETEITATWPDGSRLELRWFLGWFVEVSVPSDRSARMEGLLGSADGDFGNDLRFPDGSVVDTVDAEADQSPFVLSWAVNEGNTLFDYEAGETLETFFIPHPNPLPPPIDEAAVTECTTALGDQATAHEVSWCAYDVSATGDTGFVGEYVREVEGRTGERPTPLLALQPGTTSTTVGQATESVAGEPSLILTYDQPSGRIDVQAGTVLVALAENCSEAFVDLRVHANEDDSLLARPALCDPTGLPGVLVDDDEWYNGEAYAWLPETASYEVTLAFVLGDYDQIGEVEIYTDPSPVVLTAADLTSGDSRLLEGIADTVVYLPDPDMTFDLTGFDEACGDIVTWLDTFPRLEPVNLRACQHSNEFDLPPTDRVIPFVVFSRTSDPVDIGLRPSD